MSELSGLPLVGPADPASLMDARPQAARLRSPAGRDAAQQKAAVQAAKDFESIFLHRLLGEMKRTIPDSGLVSDATGDQMRDIFWFYLAQGLADSGGMGLWKEVYRQAGGADREEAPAAQPTLEQLL